MSKFRIFIDRILSHEGGFTDNRKDPGNWTGGVPGKGFLRGTKFGIAANTYPTLDIKNLTREDAIGIYFEDFWKPALGEVLHPAIAFQMLDAAVNHGIGNARRMLQTAAGVAPDGKIGPVTIAALRKADPADLSLRFLAARIEFYANLSTFDTFGRGWMRRMVGNLRYLAEDN